MSSAHRLGGLERPAAQVEAQCTLDHLGVLRLAEGFMASRGVCRAVRHRCDRLGARLSFLQANYQRVRPQTRLWRFGREWPRLATRAVDLSAATGRCSPDDGCSGGVLRSRAGSALITRRVKTTEWPDGCCSTRPAVQHRRSILRCRWTTVAFCGDGLTCSLVRVLWCAERSRNEHDGQRRRDTERAGA